MRKQLGIQLDLRIIMSISRSTTSTSHRSIESPGLVTTRPASRRVPVDFPNLDSWGRIMDEDHDTDF